MNSQALYYRPLQSHSGSQEHPDTAAELGAVSQAPGIIFV